MLEQVGEGDGPIRFRARRSTGAPDVPAVVRFGRRSLLTGEDEIRRELALLREGEPRFDVLEQVMRRIDRD